MLKWVAVLVLATGCMTSESTPEPRVELTDCEQAALETCSQIGYGDNRICWLAFAQSCSAADMELAHDECVAATGDDGCVLTWR